MKKTQKAISSRKGAQETRTFAQPGVSPFRTQNGTSAAQRLENRVGVEAVDSHAPPVVQAGPEDGARAIPDEVDPHRPHLARVDARKKIAEGHDVFPALDLREMPRQEDDDEQPHPEHDGPEGRGHGS